MGVTPRPCSLFDCEGAIEPAQCDDHPECHGSLRNSIPSDRHWSIRYTPEEKRPVIIIVDDREKNLRTQSVIYPDGSEEAITEAQCEEMCQKGQAQQVISVVSSRAKEAMKAVIGRTGTG